MVTELTEDRQNGTWSVSDLFGQSRNLAVVQEYRVTHQVVPVYFKIKVPLWPGQARPKRNFSFEVNRRFGTT